MYIKIHRSYRNVLAICDADLIGMKFEEGKKVLEARENFYKGELVNEERALEIIKKQKEDDATFNIVGRKSVNTALKAELIAQESIGEVQGIPFALVLL